MNEKNINYILTISMIILLFIFQKVEVVSAVPYFCSYPYTQLCYDTLTSCNYDCGGTCSACQKTCSGTCGVYTGACTNYQGCTYVTCNPVECNPATSSCTGTCESTCGAVAACDEKVPGTSGCSNACTTSTTTTSTTSTISTSSSSTSTTIPVANSYFCSYPYTQLCYSTWNSCDLDCGGTCAPCQKYCSGTCGVYTGACTNYQGCTYKTCSPFECDATTPSGCTSTCESGCGAVVACDEKSSGNLITYCNTGGQSYFADKCSSTCIGEDRGDNICRSSAFASGCTAATACNGKTVGTSGCSNACTTSTTTTIIPTCEQVCGAAPECDEKIPGTSGCSNACTTSISTTITSSTTSTSSTISSTSISTTIPASCTNHAQCSQACTNLCPPDIYGCCYGCQLGQCVSGICQCVDAPCYCRAPNYQKGNTCTATNCPTTTSTGGGGGGGGCSGRCGCRPCAMMWGMTIDLTPIVLIAAVAIIAVIYFVFKFMAKKV